MWLLIHVGLNHVSKRGHCSPPSTVLNPLNLPLRLVSWFHESSFGFRKSGLNKQKRFWNRFRFWPNQTGPKLLTGVLTGHLFSWSLENAIFMFRLFNRSDIWQRCRDASENNTNIITSNLLASGFIRSRGKMPARLVNRGPDIDHELMVARALIQYKDVILPL